MKRSSSPAQGWSRTVYKTGLARAARGPADAPPIIPSGALAALPPENTVDGMLLASVAADPLSISVATNPDVLELDVFTLYLDGVAHGSPFEIPAAAPIPPTVIFPLTAAARTEGAHTLQYKVHSTIAGQDYDSAIIPLTVDLTKAGAPEKLPRPEEFDPRILADGLSLDLLTELGDTVTAHLPAYGGSHAFSGMASGDVITPYVGSSPSATVTVTESDLTSDSIEIVFEKQAIVAATDGLRDFYYTVTDRALNVSDPSYVQQIQVVVSSGIDNLLPPVVAAYDNDDIILEAEAREGVSVTIPANPKVLQGDEVIVQWGARPQARAQVLADNTAFDVVVPAVEVFAQSPDTTPFDVSYVVTRAGASLGVSGPTQVAVNLETGGGIDPNPETGWNENLKPITVFGGVDDSGTGTDLPNVISVEDSKVDGRAVVSWLAIDDATVVFKKDDIITLLWDGVPLVPTRVITDTDITDGIDINIVVAAADIQSGGSGFPVVTYSIARPVTAIPDYNTALSPDQIVEVKSATGLPGGTDPLPAAILPEARTTAPPNIIYLLNKFECAGGTPVEIPHYINKKAGDTIIATYAATDKIVGGADIPASHWTSTPYVVPPEEVGTSSTFTLPEANLLAVTLQGRGLVDFSVENDIGSKIGPTTTAYLDNR